MKLMQNFTSEATGEIFYEPIKLNPINLIKRILAWVRIWIWGFCPNCNSDAPKIDRCNICDWDTNSPFPKWKKEKYWNRWKHHDFKDYSMRKFEEF